MSVSQICLLVLSVISSIFSVLYFYRVIFTVVGIFSKKRKFKQAKENHTFAVVICARNEEKVIGNLIESIKNNDYPQDKLKIFVCADNCTDKTAEICRNLGCIVFERFNDKQIGKGYALNYLFNQIATNLPDYQPDATFVFDADNILTKNYIKEMNKALDSGVKVCTSLRNSKNFSSSWLSMASSLHFLKEARFVHRPKMILNLSTHVSGTGFYFSKEVLSFKDGWNHTTLTEDIEFSAFNTLKGVKIGFCEDAVFYDEQPVKFKQAWKQRLRWAKGGLMGFSLFHGTLISQFVKTFNFNYYEYYFSRFFPATIFYVFSFFATNIINFILRILGMTNSAFIMNVFYLFMPLIVSLLTLYLGAFWDGLLAVIFNWKKIKAPTSKKILSIFVFPIFQIFVGNLTGILALFKKVKWDPIIHDQSITQSELEA